MSSTHRARVLIADDHTLVAEVIQRLLVKDFEVVGRADDGRSLMQMAENLVPEVIIADIGMPLMNGLHASERIKRALPTVKLIFLTVNSDPEIVEEAFRRGASGYMLKTAAANDLASAIRIVLDGHPYLSTGLSLRCHDAIPSSSARSPNCLTERQLEVLQLLAEGRSMKETAGLLNLTARTVAFHKYRIMENLQLESDADIVRYAVRNHIIFA